MIGSPSSEFVALCQSQVLLLTQALGAVSTVVYLAETTAESINPALVPLVTYPETADPWGGLREGLAAGSQADIEIKNRGQSDRGQSDRGQSAAAVFQDSQDSLAEQALDRPGDRYRGVSSPDEPPQDVLPRDLAARSMPIFESLARNVSPPSGSGAAEPTSKSAQELDSKVSAYPLMLPLAHEGVVLGMMVSTRPVHPWTSSDYQQAEQVASTLAIACVMDQRNQWLQRQLSQRQLNQADQSETFHDLLHQFRNPLTALQTFGKLMVKRLPPEDTNRPIAEGIVRESRRLQDLAQHFDTAVAEGDAAQAQTTVPPTATPIGGLLLPGFTGDDDQAIALANQDSGRASGQGPAEALAIGSSQSHGLGRSLTVQPGAIADVALPLVQSTLPLAQERGLHLVHHIPTAQPRVWLDAAALGEVLHNLLDNALKYAAPGSLVWVTAGLVQRFEGQVFQGIAVGDTGAGVPDGDQPQLFTRHFRGVQAQGEIPGTGLGLAIVQNLVRGMGGHIDLISPVRGTPWLPPEAAVYSQNPGVMFVVWLRGCSGEMLPTPNTDSVD